MAVDLQEFHRSLMDEIHANAHASGRLTRAVAVEEFARRLKDAEELQDFVEAYYEGRGGSKRRSFEVDGYSDDEVHFDGSLQLVVADIRDGSRVEALTTSDVETAFSRAATFIEDAASGRLLDLIEPSEPAHELARLIHLHHDSGALKLVRVFIVSNAALGARYRAKQRTSAGPIKVELEVRDLTRFQELEAAGGREEVDIDLTSFVCEGLPALPAGIGETGYTSYLCAVPGSVLAHIYGEHGSRLLEGNVRAFLSVKGNVNKGIRKTILASPEKFFAFNNGITATAASVDLEEDHGTLRILRVKDLQIVNGGQTTASLYHASTAAGERQNLESVYVQMKLSVLEASEAESMIPDISRFANTQNKVSDADLFANHPFHRRVEELSRRILAPARPGSQQLTHWFYERARAQYQTEQYKLSESARKQFLAKNPKDQVITKTDLAKYENSWARLPHLVSQGAQKNFIKYALTVGDHYERQPDEFNDRWFQHLVAKAIIFKATEQAVSNSEWYKEHPGYRANIVTYAIARLVQLVGDRFPGRLLDLDRIWRSQTLSDALTSQLILSARAAFDVLVAPEHPYANVTEWAKRDVCWTRVCQAPVDALPALEGELQDLEEDRRGRREARGEAREERVIDAVMEVVRRSEEGYWKRAMAWPRARQVLSQVEFGILTTACVRTGWVPSDAQARKLMAGAKRLEEEGFVP